MYDAMDAIIQYSMDEERIHFLENTEQKEFENKELFITKLKEHIYYRYIQMSCRGDAKQIEETVEEFWDMWGEEPEEEEECINDRDMDRAEDDFRATAPLNDKEQFLIKLKKHLYYDYIVMSCKGDAEKIQDWIDGYWDMWAEEEEEEEE